MKLPSWLRFESRGNPENPATSLSDPASWLWSAFGARTSTTGASVSADTALEVSAVWAAVRMISGTLATLPLHTYQRTSSGKDAAPEHPVYGLLHDRPNPELSSFVFRELALAHLLLLGNFYAEIERNNAGQPIALWPVHPASVTIARLGAAGRKAYRVRVQGDDVVIPAEDMIHVQGFSLDGQMGLVPVSVARNSIGLSMATESFGSQFFANGAQPSGVLTIDGKLSKDKKDELRDSWALAHVGLTNKQRIAVLDAGMQWTPTSIPNEAAQFLETRKFSVSEVSRVFGIPGHLIGDLERATFSNIEQQSQEYVTYCIQQWATRIEQELNYKLFDDRSHFAEFQLNGLLRGDMAARSAYYTAMSNLGVLSINEIRALENMNAIPDGDTRFISTNMQRLDAPVVTPNE